MKCPFCAREMKNVKGLYESCDCPQYGYQAPQLGRPNPGYIALQKALYDEPRVEIPKARVHENFHDKTHHWYDWALELLVQIVVYPIVLVAGLFERHK